MLGVELAGTGTRLAEIRLANSLGMRDSRLRLASQTSVQGQGIYRIAEAVVQHLYQIHTGRSTM